MLSPAIVGLLLFPSLVPSWSALSAFLLSVPVMGIIIGVGCMICLGLLARSAIAAFGDVIWIAWTWQKPYALSGEDPDVNRTAEGEVFAMRVCQVALKRQGFDTYYTRKAYRRLGRSAQLGRMRATVLVPVGLFVLGLFTLACMGLGGLLVNWIR
jgi:hypothetical protein